MLGHRSLGDVKTRSQRVHAQRPLPQELDDADPRAHGEDLQNSCQLVSGSFFILVPANTLNDRDHVSRREGEKWPSKIEAMLPGITLTPQAASRSGGPATGQTSEVDLQVSGWLVMVVMSCALVLPAGGGVNA